MTVPSTLPIPPLVYVLFSAEVNPNTTEVLIGTMANLSNQNVPEVCLVMSTPGGSVMNGLNIYNVLRGLPFKLTTHNVGNVDSIGNVIFLAGTQRYATPQATFMFHGVAFNTAISEHFDEKTLRERLDSVQADQGRIGAVITKESGLAKQDVANLFLEAQTRNADWAMSKGIIHEIRDFNATPGAPIVPLIFQR